MMKKQKPPGTEGFWFYPLPWNWQHRSSPPDFLKWVLLGGSTRSNLFFDLNQQTSMCTSKGQTQTPPFNIPSWTLEEMQSNTKTKNMLRVCATYRSVYWRHNSHKSMWLCDWYLDKKCRCPVEIIIDRSTSTVGTVGPLNKASNPLVLDSKTRSAPLYFCTDQNNFVILHNKTDAMTMEAWIKILVGRGLLYVLKMPKSSRRNP